MQLEKHGFLGLGDHNDHVDHNDDDQNDVGDNDVQMFSVLGPTTQWKTGFLGCGDTDDMYFLSD